MPPLPNPQRSPARYTILVEPLHAGAFHLTVRELPDTCTVAFRRDEIEGRARERIALDLGISRFDFDVTVED